MAKKRRTARNSWKPEDEIGYYTVCSSNDTNNGVCKTPQEALDWARKDWLDERDKYILLCRVVKVIRCEEVVAEYVEPTQPANQ